MKRNNQTQKVRNKRQESYRFSRRQLIRTGGILSLAPFLTIEAKAENDNNNNGSDTPITIDWTTVIPEGEDFSISITVNEYLSEESEEPDNQETISLSHGSGSAELSELDGDFIPGDNEYELDITLTGDGEDTPELHNITISLPRLTWRDTIDGENVSIKHFNLLDPGQRANVIARDINLRVIIIATFIGAGLHSLTRNPWVGLFAAFFILIAAWASGWATIGLVFAGLFFVVIAGIVLLRTYKPGLEITVFNTGGRADMERLQEGLDQGRERE